MFTKFNLFAAAVVSTLALSAFSSEFAGRYRIEGPSHGYAANMTAGRHSVSDDSPGSYTSNQNQSESMVGNQMAGRFRQNSAYATESVPMVAEYRTQRGEARDVSNRPMNNQR